MEIKEILYQLRRQKGWSQDQLAEKLYVTRQAVSRWETGETTPNTEALKLLSRLFDVSINTLLGCPRKLVCQCCGMPLEDDAFLSTDKYIDLIGDALAGGDSSDSGDTTEQMTELLNNIKRSDTKQTKLTL